MNESLQNQDVQKQGGSIEFASTLLERKGVEITQEMIRLVTEKVALIRSKLVDITGLPIEPDETSYLKVIHNTLDEAHGNFNDIFEDADLTFKDFLKCLDGNIEVILDDPLHYSINVANGMDVNSATNEINALPDWIRHTKNPQQRAMEAIKYIEGEAHLGVSEEMFKADLLQGKNHDDTMIYLLSLIAEGKTLPPAFVAKYSKVSEKYKDTKLEKIILDGTHRMMASAVTKTKQAVIEIDMDKLLASRI